MHLTSEESERRCLGERVVIAAASTSRFTMSFLFCDSIPLLLLSSDPSSIGLKFCVSVAAPTSSPSAA